MTIQILPVTNKQKGLLASISRQTFFDTFSPYNTPADMQLFLDKQFSVEKLEAEIDLPDNYFFIAWEGEEPMGYMRLRYWPNPVYDFLPAHPSLEINRLYATQQAIGKGVGKAMMQFALDFARGQKLAWSWLGVWEKNERAIAFYHRWGFEKAGSHGFVLGTDHQSDWLMVKKLAGNG